MASHLNGTEFQIGSTQTIIGISTSVTSTDSSLSTSKAIKDFIDYAVKPISLTVSGDWANTQYISQPVDTTGLSFTVTYGSGKTASVTPNVSPSKWSSTVGTQTATFSHTERGVTVSASKSANVQRLFNNVGGTILYIDDTADGTYTFYNAQGQVTSAPSVGTDCTDWIYTVSGATKDKFYVYNTSAMFGRGRTGTQTYPFIAWTYLDTTNQSYIDNTSYTSGLPSGRTEWSYYGYYGRVYETLDGTYTGTAIGTGKSNTSNMLSLRNGVYNQSSQVIWRDQSTYSETIWYICDQFNKGTYNLNGSPVPNNTGCDDWYIPSKDELETIKNVIGAKNLDYMLYSGGTDLSRVGFYVFSSSADSNIQYPWLWDGSGGTDQGMNNWTGRQYGGSLCCLVLWRSF